MVEARSLFSEFSRPLRNRSHRPPQSLKRLLLAARKNFSTDINRQTCWPLAMATSNFARWCVASIVLDLGRGIRDHRVMRAVTIGSYWSHLEGSGFEPFRCFARPELTTNDARSPREALQHLDFLTQLCSDAAVSSALRLCVSKSVPISLYLVTESGRSGGCSSSVSEPLDYADAHGVKGGLADFGGWDAPRPAHPTVCSDGRQRTPLDRAQASS